MMNKPIENGDKIKRKRLKVISACGECRRKKTKCNGEYPCTGCVKANVECKYIINEKPGVPTSIIRERLNNNVHLITQPVRKKSASPPAPTHTHHIESIEERLSTIEDILRNLLGSSDRHKHMLDTLDTYPAYHSPRVLHRDLYPPFHVPAIQNGLLSREKRAREEEEEEPRPQLAPIKSIHTVGTPTLRNLLNDDLPPLSHPSLPPNSNAPSSAFHRLSPNTNTPFHNDTSFTVTHSPTTTITTTTTTTTTTATAAAAAGEHTAPSPSS
ncbi:hypothetical protein BY458DRAFT_589603 [Sporodiniella umbellata]|nr:hypothetical protein BY458DRAFT_589603 [Sporodiniella umbellata]